MLSGFFKKELIKYYHNFFFETVLAKKMGLKKLNRKKPAIMDNLAFISVRHGVFLSELFKAMVLAREQKSAICQNLIVKYRGNIKNEAIFLITKDNSVVSQFRVPEEFLLNKEVCFESWMDTEKIRKLVNRQNIAPRLSTMVQDLRHGMKKVNLEAEVIETLTPSFVHTRYGNSATITNAWIADETGKIKLCLWNEQANLISAGDTIQIKNASISTYKDEKQIRLGKNGTICLLEKVPAQAQQMPIAALL
jgi:hypothetical protein